MNSLILLFIFSTYKNTLKELHLLRPYSREAHYSYYYKYNNSFCICLVRVNNDVCGAVIKTTAGSPTGLKTHLKTVHKINPNIQNSYFGQENSITKYCEKVTVKNKKSLLASIVSLACLSNFSLNSLAKSKELDYLYREVFNQKVPSANGIKQCIFKFPFRC